MKKLTLLVLQLLYILNNAQEVPPEVTVKQEKKISELVLQILDHYKQEDPVGLPVAPIPDPLPIPPFAHSFSVGKMNFKNMLVYGLSKFRIKEVKADITAMKVEAALDINVLKIVGNYTLSTWISSTRGPLTVNVTGIHVKPIATLEVIRDGSLEAQDINMDITFKEIHVNFQGTGLMIGMLQRVVNSVGSFIFESIKPFILSEGNTIVRKDLNEQIRKLPQRFPNSISPIDQLVIEVKHRIRNAKFDPYKLNDYNNSVGILDVHMSHTWLTGLSSIHRVGNITFEVRNKTVYTILEVGTQKLEGRSNWDISLVAGFMSRAGTVSFSVDYLHVQIALSQTMDTTNSPRIEDIQLELGNIQVRFDGAGTIDYLIEFGVNILPNLLRYQIMDALESPVKQKIQEVLSTVNVERIVRENVDKIDNPSSLDFLNKEDLASDYNLFNIK